MTRTPARRLAEVAQKVGVSEATVSRVLNGKAGVADHTREAVLTALDVLGYERPTQLRGERAPDHLGKCREDRVLELGQDQANEAGPVAAQLGRPLVAKHVQGGEDGLPGAI